MRVLIWCPLINLGGGKRLLERLAPAIAQQPAIEHVRMAAPIGSMNPAILASKLTFQPLTPSQTSGWLAKDTWQAATNPVRATRARLRYASFRLLHGSLMDRLAAGFDIVYAFWPHTVPFHQFMKPMVCSYHDTTILDYPEILGGPATQIEYERSKAWMMGCGRTVVSSHYTAGRLEAIFGTPKHPFPIVPYYSPPDTAIQPTALPAGIPQRYLLYPANINAHKNHETLLIAYSRFKHRHDVSLVLVGEGVDVLSVNHKLSENHYWRQDRLLGLTRRLGLEPGRDVIALGYVSDGELKGLFQSAAGLVMPSLAEGGGSLATEEAMIAGIPVLCSDIPVMREHVGERAVIWFDPYSVDSLVTAMETLFDHYIHYRELAQQNKTAARPTWDQIAAGYVDVFHAVLSERR